MIIQKTSPKTHVFFSSSSLQPKDRKRRECEQNVVDKTRQGRRRRRRRVGGVGGGVTWKGGEGKEEKTMRKRQRGDAIAICIWSKWHNMVHKPKTNGCHWVELNRMQMYATWFFTHTLFTCLNSFQNRPQHPTIESLPLSLCVQFNGIITIDIDTKRDRRRRRSVGRKQGMGI